MGWIYRSALVFLGAGIGGNLRYWLSLWVSSRWGVSFPWGTFLINVTGSLLIGVATGFLLNTPGSLGWRLFLVVGILGGYTTFSAFSMETIQLLRDRNYSSALAYGFGSCLMGFAACWTGLILVQLLQKS